MLCRILQLHVRNKSQRRAGASMSDLCAETAAPKPVHSLRLHSFLLPELMALSYQHACYIPEEIELQRFPLPHLGQHLPDSATSLSSGKSGSEGSSSIKATAWNPSRQLCPQCFPANCGQDLAKPWRALAAGLCTNVTAISWADHCTKHVVPRNIRAKGKDLAGLEEVWLISQGELSTQVVVPALLTSHSSAMCRRPSEPAQACATKPGRGIRHITQVRESHPSIYGPEVTGAAMLHCRRARMTL